MCVISACLCPHYAFCNPFALCMYGVGGKKMLCCALLCTSVGIYVPVLQCVAVCCSALQYVSVCFSVLQCSVLHPCRYSLPCVAVFCSALQYVAVCCSVFLWDTSLFVGSHL